MKRGQALVEFAIILPLLIMFTLGAFVIGAMLLLDYRLTHAATRGAIAGADQVVVSQRCTMALDIADAVLGYTPDKQVCSEPNNLVEVTLTQRLSLVVPFINEPITVTESARAEIRP